MITPEMFELIPKIDISTSEKLAAFKSWQNDDGTIEGLRKLYEAQQSVQSGGAETCTKCGRTRKQHDEAFCGHSYDPPRR